MTVPLYSIAVGTGYYDLDDGNGVTVIDAFGVGMPPVRNVSQRYGLADGALWQRHSIEDRTIQIVLDLAGESMTNLHAKRAELISALQPHQSQPIRLWYRRDETSTAKYLDCYYEGGLEGGRLKGFTERIPLRLWAGDPYWLAATSTSGAVDVRQVLNTTNYVAIRSTAGIWSNLAEGTNDEVRDLLFDSSGDLYAIGYFTEAMGAGVGRIARWNGISWYPLGTNALNGDGECVALAPNGDLYAGGEFTTAGNAPAHCVAKWDGSAWSTLGAGLANRVHALALDSTGNLYAGGVFNTIASGGEAVAKIAMWDGSAWNSLGPGLSDDVYALAVGPDDSLYVGGGFSTAGGAAAAKIAKWDGTSWSTLGSGLNGTVYALHFAPNGELYVGGAFGAAGGLTAYAIAKWTGTAWAALGDGVQNGSVFDICVALDGTVSIAGFFSASGDHAIPGKWAHWASPLWLAKDANLLAAGLNAIAEKSGVVAIGGTASGALSFPGYTVINNIGSARAYPVLTLNGPGRLYHIINYTTGERIDFNLELADGEVATLDVPANTFTSSFRGDLQNTIISGAIRLCYLNPDDNYLAVWIDDASATATYAFTPRYWGIDGVPA